MISDSPYASGDLVLKPGFGAAAGIVGALLMLALLQIFYPVSQLSLGSALAGIGSVVTPAGGATIAGLILHLVVAGLLGLLYALSQRRIPYRGLIGVGLLFGFVVWVISSLIIGRFLDESLRAVLRSWPWLLAHLGYGLTLAAVAIWRESHRGPEAAQSVRD